MALFVATTPLHAAEDLAFAEGGKTPLLGVVKTKPTPAGFAPRGSMLREEPRRGARVTVAVPGGHRVLIARPEQFEDWYEVAVLDYPDEIRKGYLPKGDVSPVDADAPFLDLQAKHWAFPAVKELSKAGLIQGAEEKFLGKKPFSRYEMAVVLARLVRQLREAKTRLVRRVSSAYGSGQKTGAVEEIAPPAPEDLDGGGEGDRTEEDDDAPPAWLGIVPSSPAPSTGPASTAGLASPSRPASTAGLAPSSRGASSSRLGASAAPRTATPRAPVLERRILEGVLSHQVIDRARVNRLEADVSALGGQLRQVRAWMDATPRQRRRMSVSGREQRQTEEQLEAVEKRIDAVRAVVDGRLKSISSRMAKVDTILPALAIERTRLAATQKDLALIARTVRDHRMRLKVLETRGI